MKHNIITENCSIDRAAVELYRVVVISNIKEIPMKIGA